MSQSVDVCMQCGAMRRSSTLLAIGIPFYSRATATPTPLNDSLNRWKLVPRHEHDWNAAIGWPPTGLFFASTGGLGNGREIEKTAYETPAVAALVDALSEAGDVELRDLLIKTAFDRDRSRYARLTATLIPEELLNDRAACAKWAVENRERLKNFLLETN